MKLAFVTPRYGPDIVGGAERLVRDFATRLADAGDAVEVLTTCATSLFTWANDLPVGESLDGTVRVLRFAVDPRPSPESMARLQPVIDMGLELPDELADEWLANTGLSSSLLDALDDVVTRVDAIVFAPYWVANTVRGATRHPDKSLIIPCLHDEAYARFASVQTTLRGVAGLIFNAEGEARLSERLIGTRPSRVVGVGFDAVAAPDVRRGRSGVGVDGDFVSYAGRQEEPKRFPLLAEWVVGYNDGLRRAATPVTLAAMGTSAWTAPPRAAAVIRSLGFVNEPTKFDVLAASVAVCNLSRNESFSYLVMEAWLAATPVIVHADADVTRGHCEASGAGLWVNDIMEFSEALDRLRGDPALGVAMGRAGHAFVTREYSWAAVLDRLHSAIAALAA